MISKIGLNCIASFENLATLETDKKVNIIYGLNGTGKSTFSNYLYDRACTEFSSCTIDGLSDEIIHVYNRKFIQDYFYEADSLKGVFTLSKENKEAEEKIKNAQIAIEKIQKDITDRKHLIKELNGDLNKRRQQAEDNVWEIKTLFTGGDRILEFCLEGLKGKKEKLLRHLASIKKPAQKPDKTAEILKKETEALKGEKAQRYDTIPAINISASYAESNKIFQKEIIGNENSTVAGLIKSFKNSDWVKKGIEYLPVNIGADAAICPFCQKNTITNNVAYEIRNYFDETYEKDIDDLKTISTEYNEAINSILSIEKYEECPFVTDKKSEFENLYNSALKILNDNSKSIKKKSSLQVRKSN